jgi:hypothetical protein
VGYAELVLGLWDIQSWRQVWHIEHWCQVWDVEHWCQVWDIEHWCQVWDIQQGDGQVQETLAKCAGTMRRGHGDRTKQAIKIKLGISTFRRFKSTGTDGIIWTLLQQSAEYLVPQLCCILRASMKCGFILKAGKQVGVTTLIAENGKADYNDAKAYRPISLSSFLMK